MDDKLKLLVTDKNESTNKILQLKGALGKLESENRDLASGIQKLKSESKASVLFSGAQFRHLKESQLSLKDDNDELKENIGRTRLKLAKADEQISVLTRTSKKWRLLNSQKIREIKRLKGQIQNSNAKKTSAKLKATILQLKAERLEKKRLNQLYLDKVLNCQRSLFELPSSESNRPKPKTDKFEILRNKMRLKINKS